MGTIYIDLLIIINIYITFFMIRSSGAFLHRKIGAVRVLLGSIAGGASSLIIFLPPLPFLLTISIKIAIGLLITLIVFGYKNIHEYLKNALIFTIITVVFAGFTMLLWLFAAPLSMAYRNGIAYFNISFPALVITTALAYGLIKLLRYILDIRQAAQRSYTVQIIRTGYAVELNALADSGNMLTDYFSGLPVIICPKSAVKELIPDVGARLLPYNTINSSGLVSVFRADSIIIKTDGKPDKSVKALVGVNPHHNENDEIKAIFNPKLLI
ncbi:MAG: sigma-E processing peptidase SpoIIGA [Oscillospiraceae bacterium]|nr:sigma-E processing peptidase SpoIIGA [Oscillospiraceae bacterium]